MTWQEYEAKKKEAQKKHADPKEYEKEVKEITKEARL